MALIVCKKCGKEISDTIKKCIHCGQPPKKRNVNISKIIIISLITIITIGGLFFGAK